MIKTNNHFLVAHHIDSFNSFIEYLEKMDFQIEHNDCIFQTCHVSFRDTNSVTDCLPRGLTHSCNVYCDIEIKRGPDKTTVIETIHDIFLMQLPVMVGCKLCPDKQLDYNQGGYFVVEGKEICFLSYETSDVQNKVVVDSKCVRFGKTSIKRIAGGLFVTLNESVDIPLFIVLRALGISSDADAVKCCNVDDEDDVMYKCVEDSDDIFSDVEAQSYIDKKVKKPTDLITEILPEYKDQFIEKAFVLGYMANRLLSSETDAETTIIVCGAKLLSTFDNLMQQQVTLWKTLLTQCLQPSIFNVFSKTFNVIDSVFAKLFHSNHFEEMDRSSYFAHLEQLRTIKTLPKISYGFFSIAQSPMVERKQLSLSSVISVPFNHAVLDIIKNVIVLVRICDFANSKITKVFLNGIWIGGTCSPFENIKKIRQLKRNGLLNSLISAYFHFGRNELIIESDSGRLLRPLFYVENNDVSYKRSEYIKETIYNEECKMKQQVSPAAKETPLWGGQWLQGFFGKAVDDVKEEDEEAARNIDLSDMLQNESAFTWNNIVCGFYKRYQADRFNWKTNFVKFEDFDKHVIDDGKKSAIVDYVSRSEEVFNLIAPRYDDIKSNRYTFMEIDPMYVLDIRTAFTSFLNQNEMYTSRNEISSWKKSASHCLVGGQIPLISSTLREIIHVPSYGVNLTVAVMKFSGKTVVNMASIKRGLFHYNKFSTYTYEETQRQGFANIASVVNITGKRDWVDFSLLDKNGIIQRNSHVIPNKTAILGKISKNDKNEIVEDATLRTHECFCEETTLLRSQSNTKQVHIKFREDCAVAVGDMLRFQNGFCVNIDEILCEEDMPFSQCGGIPDLIVDPDIFFNKPGILKEIYLSKVASTYGGVIEMDAFDVYEIKKDVFQICENDIFYNPFTGGQIQGDVFIGNVFLSLICNPNCRHVQEEVDPVAVLQFGASNLSIEMGNRTPLQDTVHLSEALNIKMTLLYDETKNNLIYSKRKFPELKQIQLNVKIPFKKTKKIKLKLREPDKTDFNDIIAIYKPIQSDTQPQQQPSPQPNDVPQQPNDAQQDEELQQLPNDAPQEQPQQPVPNVVSQVTSLNILDAEPEEPENDKKEEESKRTINVQL